MLGVLRRARTKQAEDKLRAGADYTDSGYVLVNEIGEPYTPGALTNMWHRLGTDDELLPHAPISGDAAAELITEWCSGSVANPTGNPRDDGPWDMLQHMADDYEVPLDEFLGAI